MKFKIKIPTKTAARNIFQNKSNLIFFAYHSTLNAGYDIASKKKKKKSLISMRIKFKMSMLHLLLLFLNGKGTPPQFVFSQKSQRVWTTLWISHT